MKRRNFLASLLALPLAAKPFEALGQWVIEANTESLRRNAESLLLHAPSGYKSARSHFSASDVEVLSKAARRYKSRRPPWS